MCSIVLDRVQVCVSDVHWLNWPVTCTAAGPDRTRCTCACLRSEQFSEPEIWESEEAFSYPQTRTESLPAVLPLVLFVPSDGVVGGVAGGVCLITVPLWATDDGRQLRSLSSKFRSVPTGFSPNSDSRLDRARAKDSSLSRTLELAGSRQMSWPSKVAFQGRQEIRVQG